MQAGKEIDNENRIEEWMQELLWPDSSQQQQHDNQQQFHHQLYGNHNELASACSPCASSDSEPQQHLIDNSRPQQTNNSMKEKSHQQKVALETKSDTDILDDGFKWRKYGQKSVKNSKHPRSYYRCSMVGCPVKKRVERSTLDPSLVVTTYHNKHNHHSPIIHDMDSSWLPLLDNN